MQREGGCAAAEEADPSKPLVFSLLPNEIRWPVKALEMSVVDTAPQLSCTPPHSTKALLKGCTDPQRQSQYFPPIAHGHRGWTEVPNISFLEKSSMAG